MKLKLTFLTICILILSVLCFSACDGHQDNSDDLPSDDESEALPTLDNTDFVTFYPTEPNTSGAAALEAAFRESDYYDDYYTYSDFSSYSPECYAEKYGVDIFGVTSNRKDSSDFEESYYVIHKNTSEIFLIQSSNKSSGEASDFPTGITHLALSDVNGDGLFELLISSAEADYYDNNYITIFDSKSISSRQITLGKSNFGFFKKSDGGRPAIYTAESCDLTAATELYSEIKPNMRTYSFSQPEYYAVCAGSYEVIAAFDVSATDFPIHVNGISHTAKCQTVMTYLGEPFNYYSPSPEYRPSAQPKIFGNDIEIIGKAITDDNPSNMGMAVVSHYPMEFADKLYTSYKLTLYPDNLNDAVYSLAFDYLGDRVEIPSAFSVKTIKAEADKIIDKAALYDSGKLPELEFDKNAAELPTLDSSDFITFYPSSPSSRNVEKFEEKYIISKYYDSWEPYESISNIMPNVYSEKYEIELFSVNVPKFTRTDYYLFHKNRITLVHSAFWGSNKLSTDFSGIVHLALTDVNSDGFAELLISTADRYKIADGEAITRSKISILDTQSKNVTSTHIYEGDTEEFYDCFAYFKKTESGGGIFLSMTDSYEAANELYCEIVENPLIYEFKGGELLSVPNGDYSINLSISISNASFPVYIKGLKYFVTCWQDTVYHGQTFTMNMVSRHYYVAAFPTLKLGDHCIDGNLRLRDQLAVPDYDYEITDNHYESQVFYFIIDSAEMSPGCYDVYALAYDGSVLVIEDVLTVSARD